MHVHEIACPTKYGYFIHFGGSLGGSMQQRLIDIVETRKIAYILWLRTTRKYEGPTLLKIAVTMLDTMGIRGMPRTRGYTMGHAMLRVHLIIYFVGGPNATSNNVGATCNYLKCHVYDVLCFCIQQTNCPDAKFST